VKKNLFARIVGKIHQEKCMNAWIALPKYAMNARISARNAENIYVMVVITIIRRIAVK